MPPARASSRQRCAMYNQSFTIEVCIIIWKMVNINVNWIDNYIYYVGGSATRWRRGAGARLAEILVTLVKTQPESGSTFSLLNCTVLKV